MLTACHPKTDGQTECINASMEQYLHISVNHQQPDCMKQLPMAEFAVNHGTSDTTKCTPCIAMYGMNLQMTLLKKATEGQNHRCIDADCVQATMQPVHGQICVKMRRS